jgi:hypothetical protein
LDADCAEVAYVGILSGRGVVTPPPPPPGSS